MLTFPARRILLVAAVLLASVTAPLPADEGMWPINRFPADTVRAKYGFAPSAAWLAHAQRASVRLPAASP